MSVPERASAAQSIPIRGIAQVGISGLDKVQYSVRTRGSSEKEEWLDGPEIQGPPADLDTQKLRGFEFGWPLRWTVVHWAATVAGLPAGEYDLRCRSIDRNGIAQPMPRPFAKGGRSEIQTVHLTVE